MRRLIAATLTILACGLPVPGGAASRDAEAATPPNKAAHPLPARPSDADQLHYRLLKLDGTFVKWGEPRLGTPATATYGLAEQPADFPEAINCRALAPFSTLRIARGQDLAALLEAAFGLWSAAAGVAFRPAEAGEIPDILIGAQGVPDHVAFANVWTDRSRAADGIAPLSRATICFNPDLAWVPDAAGPGEADFSTVLAHEIGHTLGLDHPGPTGALMGYSDQGDIDALMTGDRDGALRLYGPPAKN